MVALWAAVRVATEAPAPLLPDLNARLHPSDATPWTILFILTLITLLPAILMAMTPLVRLLVVFHFLRQALGTQTAPSNPTLMGLALMMTWFLMTPVLNQVDQQAVEPYRAGQITGWETIDRGSQPMKLFLLRYAREKDLALFTAAGQPRQARRPAHARGGSGLHSLGTEGRIRHRRGALSPLPDDRHCYGFDYHIDRHVPVAAGGDLDAIEDSAVCDGGWLEPAG
jgi:flagellar biosynthesis protein FliP